MTRWDELIPHDENECKCGYTDVSYCPCLCADCEERWCPDDCQCEDHY